MEHEKIAQLRQWVGESQRIVFFGGAGVSTESGIPDFRSTDGLYSQSYDFPPETILSRSFFDARPAEFYRFYRDKMLCLDAKPNRSHRVLARWEKEGKLSAVVTERVYELHGSIHRNRCMRCGKAFPVSFIAQGTDIPYCSCGGIVKPDVVLYEEGLDSSTLRGAADAIRSADLLLVGGTSLAVYPAAGLLQYYQGKRLVLINKSPTPADGRADLLSAAAGLEPEEDN